MSLWLLIYIMAIITVTIPMARIRCYNGTAAQHEKRQEWRSSMIFNALTSWHMDYHTTYWCPYTLTILSFLPFVSLWSARIRRRKHVHHYVAALSDTPLSSSRYFLPVHFFRGCSITNSDVTRILLAHGHRSSGLNRPRPARWWHPFLRFVRYRWESSNKVERVSRVRKHSSWTWLNDS